MKKIVLITYTVEADTDLSAIFALRKSLNNLSESELEKFDALRFSTMKENQSNDDTKRLCFDC